MKIVQNPLIRTVRRLFFAHSTCIAAWCVVSTSLSSCGTSLDHSGSSNTDETVAWGKTEFALTAELDGTHYALRDAEFALDGPEEVLLRSNDYPDDPTLVQELQSGQYSLELLPGYRLVALSEGKETEVGATLETPNPQTLLVSANQTTAVNMLFRVAQEAVAFGTGSVAVGLSIEPADPGGVFFSEFMINPAALADTEGEWLEVMNTTSRDVDLNGCKVQRDASSFTIGRPLVVPGGGFVTLANGPSPGFTPDYEYSGISLPNTAVFVLSLTCEGVELDTLQADPGSWPLSAGASAQLNPSSATPSNNDDGAAWCLANTSYSTDFGTPGAANDPCQN